MTMCLVIWRSDDDAPARRQVGRAAVPPDRAPGSPSARRRHLEVRRPAADGKEVVTQLAVNPNTVFKSYRELEYEGLVEGRPGAGTFVLRRPPGPPPGTHATLARAPSVGRTRARPASTITRSKRCCTKRSTRGTRKRRRERDDRNIRARQAVRTHVGAARMLDLGTGWADLGPGRRERRGQDDAASDARRFEPSDVRRSSERQLRRRAGARTFAAAPRAARPARRIPVGRHARKSRSRSPRASGRGCCCSTNRSPRSIRWLATNSSPECCSASR